MPELLWLILSHLTTFLLGAAVVWAGLWYYFWRVYYTRRG